MTALAANALNANNLLDMPSTTVQPGQDLSFTYRYGALLFGATGGIPPAEAIGKLAAKLDEQPGFFRVGDLALSGSAISGTLKVRQNVTARTVDGLFAQVRDFRIGTVNFELMQVVPAVLGHQAGSFSPADAAAINGGSSEFRPPIARAVSTVTQAVASGVKTASNTARAASEAAQNTLSTLKWIVIAVAVVYGLYVGGPFLKTFFAKKGG